MSPPAPPGHAHANAKAHPQIGRNNDTLVVQPTTATGDAGAFSWAKAGGKTEHDLAPRPPGPVNVVEGVVD